MSKRIDQTLDVLAEVWAYRPTVGRLRSRAVRRAARKYGVKPQTILDKMVRQLRPKVRTAAELDALIARWWGDDSVALRETLLARAVTEDDHTQIQDFFSVRDSK